MKADFAYEPDATAMPASNNDQVPSEFPGRDHSNSEELPADHKRTLLDPDMAEACKIMSAVIDQNVSRLLMDSKRAIEMKDFGQFGEARRLIDQLSALKVFVNTTYAHIAAADH